LSLSLKNLEYLRFHSCPVQESLSPLVKGCPNLIELDISGDSWIKASLLQGISTHKTLQFLHLGHIEHSDMYCDKINLTDYLDKVMDVSIILERS